MLTFESPFYTIEGVVVFRDHATKNQFYYLAGPPHLSKDAAGKLEFTLLKYRNALQAGGAPQMVRDQLGGAFLMLGVDCGLGDSLYSTVKGELGQYVPQGGGDVILDPVLYTSGTAQIVCLDYSQASAGAAGTSASKMVRGVIGSATPSLLQDLRAIFSVSLDTDGATLIEQSYQDDLSPIGVMYNVQFQGLRPAISVKATADMSRVYHSLSMDLKIGVHTGGGSSSSSSSSGGTSAGTSSSSSSSSSSSTAAAAPRTLDIHVKIAAAGNKTTVTFNLWPGPNPPATMPAPIRTVNGSFVIPGGMGTIVFGDGDFAAADEFVIGPPGGTPPNAITMPTHTGAGVITFTPPAAPAAPAQPTAAQAQAAAANNARPATGAQGPANSTPPTANTGGSGGFGLDADISYMMQTLQETGAIKIEIIRQQEGASIDAMQKEAMDLLKEDILKDFFKPCATLIPAAPPAAPAAQPAVAGTNAMNQAGAGGGGTKVSIGFQLQIKDENDLKTETFEYDVASPETRTHAPNGFFSALLNKTKKEDLIKTIDLDDPFFKTLQTQATTIADFATIGLKQINVEMQYGGTIDAPKIESPPMLFTPADTTPKWFQAFLDNSDMSYRFRYQYSFAPAETIAAPPDKYEYQTDWQTTVQRALVVDPPSDVPMLHLYIDQGVVDWDVIKHIETTVVYDDGSFHAERKFEIDPTFRRQEWIVRLTDPTKRTYSVQHTWMMKDTERLIVGKPVDMDAAQLFVFDPFVDRLPIVVTPEVDATNIVAINIDFHYADPKSKFDYHKLVQLTPPYRATVVPVPILNLTHREYDYSVSLIKANASQSENRSAVTTEDLILNLGDGSNPYDVTVQLLGDGSVGGKLSGIQVELRCAPLEGQQQELETHLFDPSVPTDKKWTQRLLLRVDLPTHQYEYRTTCFFNDGSDPLVGDWIENENSLLVLQPARLLQS